MTGREYVCYKRRLLKTGEHTYLKASVNRRNKGCRLARNEEDWMLLQR